MPDTAKARMHRQVCEKLTRDIKEQEAVLARLNEVLNYHSRELSYLETLHNYEILGDLGDLCVKAVTVLQSASVNEVYDWLKANGYLKYTEAADHRNYVIVGKIRRAMKYNRFLDKSRKDYGVGFVFTLRQQTDTPVMPSTTENQDGSNIHTDHTKRD